jgi:hypothetical protein
MSFLRGGGRAGQRCSDPELVQGSDPLRTVLAKERGRRRR